MLSRFAITLLLTLIPLWGYSKDSVSVIFNYDDGVPKSVVVEGRIDEDRYLGISFYPATFKDPIQEGYHMVQEIKKGSFKKEFTISSPLLKYYGSSYEIALWERKVDKKDCNIKDCIWCKTRGYHLEGLAFYQTGYFNTLWKK